jgi:hypothetical protein
MNQVRVAAWLMFAAIAGLTVLPLDAQESPSAQALSERARQIQGQAPPEAAQPSPPTGAGAPEGLKRVEAVGGEAPSQAPAREGPALDEDQVRTRLRESLGVEVLKIEAVESERGPAYAVTVMNPPGNDNSAFLVETLVVDGATGEVLGRVLQTPRVAAGSAAPSGQVELGGGGLEIRRRSLR